jgi:hypothetical protein
VVFSEQPPSKQWLALKYRGEEFAEVWFKPQGEPCALTFRIPQKSFHIPGMNQLLTVDNLLKAVAIAPQEIESWHQGDVSHPGMNGSNPELTNPLPPPPQHVIQVEICVRLNPPPEAVARAASGEPEIPSETWQDLEARWKAILSLEATMDTLRITMEGLLLEMEASLTKTLTVEQKIHALRSDVAQWNKTKNGVRFALPKVKDFIHRSTWAIGAPERKRLEELYKGHIQPHIPFAKLPEMVKQLEDLQKQRQVLSAQGATVYQSCRSLASECSNALRTLQSNAAAKAHRKKVDPAFKSRFFKDR